MAPPLPIRVEHRIGVLTPAQPIWDLIMDVGRWGEWNPLYTKASGKVGFDEKLRLTVAIPGEQPREITPTIVDWTPNEQIIWRLSMLGGLIRSTRYIETETLENGNCIFSNGELFEGPAMRLIGKKQQRAIKRGFAAFGEAVRDRAEAAWNAAHPDATSASA